MRVKKVSGNSHMGWNPTNPPMRGYMSSKGRVAWPQPKVWTQRSAWMVSAMASAAWRMLGIWVCSMRSMTARVLFSHCFATLLIGCNQMGMVSTYLFQDQGKQDGRAGEAAEH